MEENNSGTAFKNMIFGFIAFLLLILVIEAAILISKVHKSDAQPERGRGAVREQQAEGFQPGVPGYLQHQQPLARQKPVPQRSSQPSSASRAQLPVDQDMEEAFLALEQMQQRMNRMFENAMRNAAPMAESFFSDMDNMAEGFAPAFDIQDDGKNYIVQGDLPGLEKDKIGITVRSSQLLIDGKRENVSEKKDEQTGFYSQERSYGSFSRSLPLPGPVDEAAIKADYKNGVLTIILPKAPEKDGQKVAIS